MRTLVQTSIFALFTLGISLPAHAREIYEFYNGVRSLGMGGAYVATVNDETALFTNPAGLGKLRDPYITLIDPEVQSTTKLTDFINSKNLGAAFSAQGILDAVKNKPDRHFNERFQLSPSLVLPNFGIGLFTNWETNAETNAAGDTVTLNYRNDTALALAYDFRLFDGILKLGFNGLLIDRIEANKDLPTTTTGLTYKSIASEGLGLKVNAGMLLTAPVLYLPSFGVVVRDVGGTSYTINDGLFYSTTTRPDHEFQKVDVGMSISPILSPRVRSTFTLELQDAMTKDAEEKKDVMRRFHAGMELNFADFLFLRGGYNQKYFTAGFEFASQRFQLQGAYYGEDIGSPSASKEDRRFVGKLAIRF